MPGEPTSTLDLDLDAEPAIVSRLLDPPDAHTLAELHSSITDVSDQRIDAAVTSLAMAGVLRGSHARTIYATDALLRLDVLGMIGV
jgi:hypothetical protein